jgi:hypothetical protein
MIRRKRERVDEPFGGSCSVVPGHDDLVVLDLDTLLLKLSSESLEQLRSLALVDDCESRRMKEARGRKVSSSPFEDPHRWSGCVGEMFPVWESICSSS